MVLEFSLNDAADAPFASPERRGYEQLLRNLLRLPGGPPALIQLHHHRWNRALPDSDIIESGVFYETPAEMQLTLFAQVRPGGWNAAWLAGSLAALPLLRGWQQEQLCSSLQCATGLWQQTVLPLPQPNLPPFLPSFLPFLACSTTISPPCPCGQQCTR